MKNSKLELRSPDEAEAVYYEAFMHCDKDVMAVLWANGDVVCIHPGAAAIIGHEAVVRSWAHIFANAKRPEIKFTVMKKTVSENVAVHLVAEEISTGGGAATLVLATNVYEHIDGSWLMVSHHGSLVQQPRRGHTLQ